MHMAKKGLRAFGIAESYRGRKTSTLAGVVMRKDLRIDGYPFSRVTIGGMNATDIVIQMVDDLHRQDLNVIMLSGCVIAWFNVMDPDKIYSKTRIQVICVTYEDSEGLSDDIWYHFPNDDMRYDAYKKLGDRSPVLLHTHQMVFIQSWGIDISSAGHLCDDFTLEGKIPEPLRVARLCARSAHELITD